MKIYLLWDIDLTLLVDEDSIAGSPHHSQEHLTPVDLEYSPPIIYRAIYLKIMSRIMQRIASKPHIKQGFITMGAYSHEITKDFEKIYGLPKDTFKDCVFIGRNIIKDSRVTKGEVLTWVKTTYVDVFDGHAIHLVDDTIAHVVSTRKAGFNAILACGFPWYNKEDITKLKEDNYIAEDDTTDYLSIRPEYLKEIVNTLNLGADLLEYIDAETLRVDTSSTSSSTRKFARMSHS